MIDDELSVVHHSFDKENFEEYIRHYLNDETITISDKQWSSIAKHIDQQVDLFYDELLKDVQMDWKTGVFDQPGGATRLVRTLGL